nr:MAG TPA: Lysozyme [Caudoviricetes sp.]
MYEKATELIKEFEGFETQAYKCPAGIWTIGYGWTHGVKEGDTITKEEASKLVQSEVEKIAKQIENALGNEVFGQLNENQVSALIDFVYNLGIGTFKQSSLFKKIMAGDFNAAGEVFNLYVKGGGKVLPGLVRRREAEKELWYA